MKNVKITVVISAQVPDSLDAEDLFAEIEKKNIKVGRLAGSKSVVIGGAVITEVNTTLSEDA